MYGVNCNFLFGLKNYIKNRTLHFFFYFWFLSVFYFGFAIRICERPLLRPFYEDNKEKV